MTSLTRAFETMSQQFTVTDTDEIKAVVCPDCEGTGYIRFDVEYTDERFGKMYPCPNPDCPVRTQQKQSQVQTVMRTRSSWRPDYAEMTFDAFNQIMGKTDARWIGKRGAYVMAMAFARFPGAFTQNEAAQYVFEINWPKASPLSNNSVVFTGTVGVGKTGLAIAAANDLMAQGKIVIFIRTRDLIAHIQDSYGQQRNDNPENKPTDSCLQIYMNAPYLILDEFELQNYTRDRLEIIEKIIRARGDRPQPLPTLITTNLTTEQMYSEDRWGQRIADIVAKFHQITVDGVKLRQTMPVANTAW